MLLDGWYCNKSKHDCFCEKEIIFRLYFCLCYISYVVFSHLQTYVRDIYPFRRSVSPQLNLVHMLPDKGQELIQKQVSQVSKQASMELVQRSG